ncbi:cGMP-specific 3',5'-cyclic phosphodiesterase-like [Centruroides sculpturatus]|uniref:cGMP-specific 3',5'-cyclic phosphodiesterase-like n=1 Tax=Centruroides sculpturatus TaxID=218467 RepID=UPI000C6E512B|nr:cGMP-specific 3',5'-cyclic phosphodiesterase-like [Centruroides sculpturatus]
MDDFKPLLEEREDEGMEFLCRCGHEDQEMYVDHYLITHPKFAKKWYSVNASQDMIAEWLSVRGLLHEDIGCTNFTDQFESEKTLSNAYAEFSKGGRNSVTTELFRSIVHQPKRKRSMDSLSRVQIQNHLKNLDEHELLMELIRDISNELDIDTLCHKILVNVCMLTNSDRGSLFLAKGSRDSRYLVAKLFDVTPKCELEDAISAAEQMEKIPPIQFGVGIAGHVALSKETVNIKDAYQDPRFNKDIDFRTGYRTISIMCMPIVNYQGDVIGVAQCINKTEDDKVFNKQDEEVFRKYLTFCGIGIQNAQLFEMSVQEYKRNQVSLRNHKEHKSILILHWTFNWLGTDEELDEMKNILRLSSFKEFGVENIKVSGRVLSIPIFNSENKVIGVAQLVNKLNGEHFTEIDISTFEAFSIFCGLGIHNTQMYENAIKLMAKQRVALEVLSYHASSSVEEMNKLMHLPIPSANKFNLYSFEFSDFELADEDTCKASLRMFMDLDLIRKFHIPYQILCRWTLSVKKNYRNVTYHNWRHALNVAQTMFAMLTIGNMKQMMSDLEMLALLVACLCHDLDHRGTNNSFQTKIESPLATLYTTSTMEHHHFDQCIMILNSEGNNIFQSFSTEDYKTVISYIESAILATDLALYFKKKDTFGKLVETGTTNWLEPANKDLLRGMMMTACDISAICKPWEIQRKVAELVASEFFEQGDLEKERLKEKPIAMMDREKKDELPKMQVGFINCICLPVYKALTVIQPALQPLLDGCERNKKHWEMLADEYEKHLREPTLHSCRHGRYFISIIIYYKQIK